MDKEHAKAVKRVFVRFFFPNGETQEIELYHGTYGISAYYMKDGLLHYTPMERPKNMHQTNLPFVLKERWDNDFDPINDPHT